MSIKNKGFTLLELSIVLVIGSLILVASFESGKYFMIQNHIKSTNIKLNTIQNALDIYVIEHGKLPCPAGFKNNTGKSLLSCEISDDLNGLYVHNGVARGSIPYADLGLTRDNSFDAWRSEITYSVNINSTKNIKQMSSNYSGITIYDNYQTNKITDRAVYTLVSHGKNKLGAFDVETHSQVDIVGISNDEKLNIAGVLINSNEVLYFSDAKIGDDVVRYKTWLQLIGDTYIEDVECNVTNSIVTDLVSVNSITDSISFSIPTNNYIKYNQELKSSDPYKYKIKCFKYGRLGVFSYD